LASYPALDLRYQPGPETGALHDLLYAELDAFEPLAIHDLEAGDGWRVFFRSPEQRDNAQAAVASALGDRLLSLSPAEVHDEDWARRSQAALTAIQVGRIIVAPPWDVPQSTGNPEPGTPNPIIIVIEPSMGFGTGHHATTRLCLSLLQGIALSGMRVIDVGTGSGVLAIAASRLGAATVTAIDNDPDALQNARENIARQTENANHIHVIEGDLSAISTVTADVVVANLTGAVLQRHAASLRGMVEPSGLLVVSGFSPDEMDDVVAALGMPLADNRHEGEWAAALLRRT
jgi:ribosomal protein L11 methyltransferase